MYRRHIALVGPTASGKSWLALQAGAHFDDLELVSVDSMQVYRGMDIGTAKPTAAEQCVVPHHCIDLVDADNEFSLSDFQATARAAIADIERRGKRALLVGGTGLYLQAITDDLELPGQYPAVRAELDTEPSTTGLHERLSELDPVAAARIEPDNRRRIVRALEVTVGSGRPFSSFGPGVDAYPPTPFHLVGLWLPRDVGADRIDRRVDDMVAAGWVDEVDGLRRRSLSKTARQALGYKELLAHLDGTPLDDAVDEIKRRTRAFARRQRVWFRRDPRIRWVGTADGDAERLVGAVLRECEHS